MRFIYFIPKCSSDFKEKLISFLLGMIFCVRCVQNTLTPLCNGLRLPSPRLMGGRCIYVYAYSNLIRNFCFNRYLSTQFLWLWFIRWSLHLPMAVRKVMPNNSNTLETIYLCVDACLCSKLIQISTLSRISFFHKILDKFDIGCETFQRLIFCVFTVISVISHPVAFVFIRPEISILLLN